jgi:hypothetical protein
MNVIRIIIFTLLGCLMILPSSVNAKETTVACSKKMPASVEAKLLPVLDVLAEAVRKDDWFDKKYEQEFYRLLKSKDKASQEARVALMDYYVGEHFGEELVCAVALDGEAIKSTIITYQNCDIKPTRSPVLRNRSLPLRKYVLEILKRGNVKGECTFD